MKRFRVVEVRDDGAIMVVDTLGQPDKRGEHPKSLYYVEPGFEVDDWVDIIVKLQERPVKAVVE